MAYYLCFFLKTVLEVPCDGESSEVMGLYRTSVKASCTVHIQVRPVLISVPTEEADAAAHQYSKM